MPGGSQEKSTQILFYLFYFEFWFPINNTNREIQGNLISIEYIYKRIWAVFTWLGSAANQCNLLKEAYPIL